MMTVGELKSALEGISDDLPVEVYGPGDSSVGIFDLYAEVTGAAVVMDYDEDEEGNPKVVSRCFQLVVVE